MALRTNEAQISKGGNTSVLSSVRIEDNFKNKIFVITPARSPQNQSGGPADTKVVDLLRITRTFVVKGHVLSNAEKNTLIQILEGGGLNGGGVNFQWEDGGDFDFASGTTVFIESCNFSQIASDEPDTIPDDFAKHEVTLTMVKGTVV